MALMPDFPINGHLPTNGRVLAGFAFHVCGFVLRILLLIPNFSTGYAHIFMLCVRILKNKRVAGFNFAFSTPYLAKGLVWRCHASAVLGFIFNCLYNIFHQVMRASSCITYHFTVHRQYIAPVLPGQTLESGMHQRTAGLAALLPASFPARRLAVTIPRQCPRGTTG
jgi:hypothetical protein